MFLLSFIAGLAGSLHCLGMCGPIVLAYSAQPRGSIATPRWNPLGPSHFLYNGGRLLGYTVLGAMAGLVGGMLGSLRLAGPYVAIVAGVLLVVTGVLLLDIFPWYSGSQASAPGWFRRSHFRLIGNLISLRTHESVFYLGVLTAFLPCGMLYGMFLQAAASGSAFHGALHMLAFGAGTAPALLFAGLVSSFVSVNVRLFAHRLAAVLLIVMGVLLMIRGIGLATASHVTTAPSTHGSQAPMQNH